MSPLIIGCQVSYSFISTPNISDAKKTHQKFVSSGSQCWLQGNHLGNFEMR